MNAFERNGDDRLQRRPAFDEGVLIERTTITEKPLVYTNIALNMEQKREAIPTKYTGVKIYM